MRFRTQQRPGPNRVPFCGSIVARNLADAEIEELLVRTGMRTMINSPGDRSASMIHPYSDDRPRGIKDSHQRGWQLQLFERAIHPEMFPLRGRRMVRSAGMELEVWLCVNAHVVRIQNGTSCLSEVFSPAIPDLQGGYIVWDGHDAEHDLERDCHGVDVHYVSSIQTEMLPESLYTATLKEMTEHAKENDSLICFDADGQSLSVADVQRHAGELHVQTYHLKSAGGIVIRTQSIFEAGVTGPRPERTRAVSKAPISAAQAQDDSEFEKPLPPIVSEAASLYVVWDAESVLPSQYAELVGKVGDLVRARGGLGVRQWNSGLPIRPPGVRGVER